MVHPRRTMAIEVPLRNKIAAYLATNYEISRDQALASLPAELTLWGKMKQLSGGDLIHAWDLVSAYHTSRDSVRDATFIKVDQFLGDVLCNADNCNCSIRSRSTGT